MDLPRKARIESLTGEEANLSQRAPSSPLNGSISGDVDIPTPRQVSEVKCGLHCWKEKHTTDSSMLGFIFAGFVY